MHTSLLQLASWDAAIAEALLAAPCQVMPVLHMALDIAQEQILAQLSQTQSDSTLSCKPLAQVRLKGVSTASRSMAWWAAPNCSHPPECLRESRQYAEGNGSLVSTAK